MLAAGTVVWARWDNGGAVAMGYRKLGRGRVIVLGAKCWRDSTFLHFLFSSLGIRRRADADSPQVWARKFITKNGLQDWLITFNNSNKAITTDVKFRVQRRPSEVINELTRQPVPFTYTPDGWVQIRDVTMAGYATQVFGVERSSLVGAIPFWWFDKTTYWKAPPLSRRGALLVAAAARAKAWDRLHALNMDHWKFYADKTGKLAAGKAWRAVSFNDARWRNISDGPWDWSIKSLKNYHGVGLYRRTFVLPLSWTGRHIVLSLYNFNNPIAYDHAKFYINGVLVASYQQRYWSQTLNFDVTAQLHAGSQNVLAVEVQGGKKFSGLCGPVWLAPEVALKPEVSLAGPWQCMRSNFTTAGKVVLPGKANGRYLMRMVAIPKYWAARSIYLHVQTASQWLGSVVINGHPINYNSFLHPFGTIADINITPYVRFGENNQIQLWPFAAIPWSTQPGKRHLDMEVRAISIGCDQRLR